MQHDDSFWGDAWMRQDGLILFRSLTFAQRAAHVLERGGFTATVRKAPQGLTDRGCTYCVRLRAEKMRAALALLEQRGMEHGRVFVSRDDGGWQEVRA